MKRCVILIADDDEADVLFLRQAMIETCPGAEVYDVRDGQEAIDYLSGGGKYSNRACYPYPDRLFLDVKMPRRSGLEVLKWIQDHPELGRMDIVVLSGSQLSDDQKRAAALGATYIVKPVEYSALRDLVQRLCGKEDWIRR